MDALIDLCAATQSQWFENWVQPLVFALGWGQWMEVAFEATGWLLVGLLQLAVMLLVIQPLEWWRPVEPVVDHRAVRSDVIYTLIHRLGVFRLALFFTLDPLADGLFGALRAAGWSGIHLDDLWPGVTDVAAVAFVMYLVLFDALNYAIHRAQHQWAWWWALHAVHHSQRQMTMWTDQRNHLLDDVLVAVVWAVVAQAVGMPPEQFVAVVAITQLLENFQHANLRLSFGTWGERCLISPRFHRWHHSVGWGHEATPAMGSASGPLPLGGHNFGVLFPWWDDLLGTALRRDHDLATGIRDQIENGRDYGQGVWAQQTLGLRRMWQALHPRP
jgi:sterol desaturase/sphingolipid hydroxylase (fatty acid hydroxylase superfamily)